MIVREQVLLASLSTLRVGGPARFVCEATSEDEVREAIAFAKERELPWRVLGQGSNILASDSGFEGVIILMKIPGIRDQGEGIVCVGAGESWDGLVRYAADRRLWGIENLAGIPGTVGASPVQNIGAYGTEVKSSVITVTVLNTESGDIEELTNAECRFGYRESRFKHEPHLIILSVTFSLRGEGDPQLGYADLMRARSEGVPMDTPEEIGAAVRDIRSRKFPDLRSYGTAGSFFKNPVISAEEYQTLAETYPELPGFETSSGIKVPLAFVLDKILSLRGYAEGNVALFSNQPLVLVTHEGATEIEVNNFADRIADKVLNATGIEIEREVRSFP
jgi:UDP-N-acetylmuramate dehydrogenase